MFRPYSMTSIAAWTVGSLAGNYAYHEAKQGSAKPRITKASCPLVVRTVIDKLKAIERETISLVDGGREFSKVNGQLNMTPFIRLFAYGDWLQSNRQAIRAEIAIAYQTSISDGYLWPPAITENAQNGLDSLLDYLNEVTRNLRSGIDDFISQEPDAKIRQKFDEIMRQRQKLCRVDENTCKLVDSNDGNFIINCRSQGPHDSTSKSRPIASPRPKTRIKQPSFPKDLYIARNSETLGPYKYNQLVKWLETGIVSLDDLVAYDGAPEWVKLQELIAEVNQAT